MSSSDNTMAANDADEPKEPLPPESESSDPCDAAPDRADTTPSSGVAASSTSSSAETGPVAFSELPGLPRLRYRVLEHHRAKLCLVVSLLVLESSLLPMALYYGLWFSTPLRHGIIFAIITSFFGIVTGVEFTLRCYKLAFRGDRYRPVGTGSGAPRRWAFDFTHWTLSFGYAVMTGLLIGASVPYEPLVRPLAMPVSVFFVQVGLLLLWTGWMHAAGRPAPFRISSVPRGGRVPPLVFTFVEDVVGVDGGGGSEYRKKLLARYEASPTFRIMIAELNWFWAAGALADGIGNMVVIWTVPEEVAYGVGWGSPLVFVLIWVVITVIWVRRSLRLEKEHWRAEHMDKEREAQQRI